MKIWGNLIVCTFSSSSTGVSSEEENRKDDSEQEKNQSYGNQDDFDKDKGNGCNKVNEINEREHKGNVSRTCGKTYQASKN